MLEASWLNFLGSTENLSFPKSDQHRGATTQPGRAYLDARRIFIYFLPCSLPVVA